MTRYLLQLGIFSILVHFVFGTFYILVHLCRYFLWWYIGGGGEGCFVGVSFEMVHFVMVHVVKINFVEVLLAVLFLGCILMMYLS